MQREPIKHKFWREKHLFRQPSFTFSCLVAINGVIGNRSDAALPELNTTFRIQPTNDSIIYLTPWSRSSDDKPYIWIWTDKKSNIRIIIIPYKCNLGDVMDMKVLEIWVFFL